MFSNSSQYFPEGVDYELFGAANCRFDLLWCTPSLLKDFSLQCLLRLLSLGSFSGFNIGFVKGWLILGPSDFVVWFN